MSTLVKIPSALPPLPRAPSTPWSAEVVEAHNGLTAAFLASRRALNLDESDPIRLGHHIQQAVTFMTSIVDVLGSETSNPLPPNYIAETRGSIALLIDGLRTAHSQAASAYVSP
jgi:hypothetical protein